MSTLLTCIRKAGKALPQRDADILTQLRQGYVDDGLGDQAGTRAIEDLEAEISQERDALIKRIKGQGGKVPESRLLFKKSTPETKTGFEGAIDSDGKLELVHYAHNKLTKSDPSKWRTGASMLMRSEANSAAPNRTYFGVEAATEHPYKREQMLGQIRHVAKVDPETIYNANKNPEKLWNNRDTDGSQSAIKDAGYSGFIVDNAKLGKVVALFNSVPLTVEKVGTVQFKKSSTDARMKRAKEMGFDTDQVWYHGTASDIEEFIPGYINRARPFTFFTKSQKFANSFTEDLIGDPVVYPVYLKAENTFDAHNLSAGKKSEFKRELTSQLLEAEHPAKDVESTVSEYMAKLDETENWHTVELEVVQDTIKTLGYDSFLVGETGEKNIAVYESNQIRSVNAEFDYDAKDSGNLVFSKSSKSRAKRLGEVAADGKQYIKDVKDTLKSGDFFTGHLDKLLKTIPLRYIQDFSPDTIKTQVEYVSNLFAEQDARINELTEKYSKRTNVFQEYAVSHPEAETTVNLMFETTEAGVDPSKAYQPLEYVTADGQVVKLKSELQFKPLMENINRALSKLQQLARLKARSPGGNAEVMEQIKVVKAERAAIKNLWAQEKNRKAAEPAITRTWNALSEDSQDMYNEVRDIFSALRDEEDAALEQRITDLAGDDDPTPLIEQVKQLFESNKIQEPYFKLHRQGDYWVAAYDDSGATTAFWRFENTTDRRAKIEELKAEGIKFGSGKKFGTAQLEKIDPVFAAGIVKALNQLGGPGAHDLADSVWQQYLARLPEMSIRKQQMHRKKRKGYELDMTKGLNHSTLHGSHQIAKLEFSGKIDVSIQDIKEASRESHFDEKDGLIADSVINELEKRVAWIRNPTSGPLANHMTRFGFVWYLGATPAAALVNMTQTAIVGLPVLAAKFGYGKSTNALLQAMKDSTRKGGIESTLSGEELDAFNAFHAKGLLTKTLSHSMAGMASEGTEFTGAKTEWVMNKVSYLFHRAEVWNREATSLAAYRLAKADGMSHEDAMKSASDMTWTSHFDYCVDTETEILTNRGWLKYNELTTDDVSIAIDENGAAVETNVSEVNVFHGQKTVIDHSINHRRFSMVVTPNHDCLTQNYSSRDKKWQKPRKVKAANLTNHHNLMRVPLVELQRTGGEYGENFATLLGWIAAEGQYAKFRNCKHRSDVRFAQSDWHNPTYVKEIDALLATFGDQSSRYITRKGEIIVWTLKGELRKRVLAAMPEKLLTMKMFAEMNASEMKAVTLSFAKGDGSKRANGAWTIGQKDNRNCENLEVLQAMSTALGVTSTMSHSQGNGTKNLILFAQGRMKTTRTAVRTLVKKERVVDTVWCPTTGTGTWIARRNGAVFVTGNSNQNRPSIMQNDFAKVIFLFKQYSLNMTYRLARDFNDMFRNESAEVRKEAGMRFGGIIGMTGLFAGAAGMPLFSVFEAILNSMLGDEDDPYDIETALRVTLTESFGATGSQLIMDGAVNTGLGIDVSSRVSLNDLWLRDPQYDLEGKDLWNHYLAEAMGPVFKVGDSMFEGARRIKAGSTERGIEMMIPKAARDILKAHRFMSEGAVNLKGDPILVREEFGINEVLAQGIGFTPAQLNLQYEQNSALKRAENSTKNRRKLLLNRYALALRMGDSDGVSDVNRQIQTYNRSNPKYQIKAATIKKSMKARRRTSQGSISGITLDKNLRHLEQELNFVE